MSGNWIQLHRKLLEWEWYDDNNVVRVFLHLLLSANWKPNRWRGIEIGKGQLLRSQPKLAEETHLTVEQIRHTLRKLKSTGEITTQSTRYGVLITLVKWGDFQNLDKSGSRQVSQDKSQEETDQIHKEVTGSSQGVHREFTPLEEGNNNKKEKREEGEGGGSPAAAAVSAEIGDFELSESDRLSASGDYIAALGARIAMTADQISEIAKDRGISQEILDAYGMKRAAENWMTPRRHPIGPMNWFADLDSFTSSWKRHDPKAGKQAHAEGPAWLTENWREIASEESGIPANELKTFADLPTRHHFAVEAMCKGLEGSEVEA